MRAGDIAAGAPVWVWVLLVVLVVLGVRRLRTRDVPVLVALIPVLAFGAWSISGVVGFAGWAGGLAAAGWWLGGGAVGALSGLALPDPRGQRLPGGRLRQPGSVLPLLLYLGTFVARFACGAWAAIAPDRAMLATGIGIAVGAAMTARLIVGVLRWQPRAG